MDRTPTISLIHPTARLKPSEAFPRGWRAAHDAWLERCDHPEHVEYVLAVHESRWNDLEWDNPSEFPARAARWQSVSKWNAFHIVKNLWRDCVVDQTNCAAEHTRGPLICGVADDFYPPEHWDTLLLQALAFQDLARPELVPLEGFAWSLSDCDFEGEYHLVFSSGATPERDRELMIAGAITRKRYERYGCILDPDFESMFADNWMAFRARRDEELGFVKIIERLDIQFDHRHPIFDKGQVDDVYRQQNRQKAYRDGFVTFQRKAYNRRTIAHFIPGETFSHRVLFGLLEVNDYMAAKGFIVERYGAHTSNVYATRIELADALLTIGSAPDFVLSSDDDNVISPENLDMLIADLDKHPEIDIVTGWSWCDTGDYETNPFRMSCGRQGEKLECKWFSVEDYLKMQAAGKIAITSDDVAPDAFWSGFPVVLMRGSVLAKLGWESFRPMLGEFHRGFTSEDTTFFYRAHQAGIKSAVDLRVKVPHLKLRAIEPQIIPAEDREKFMEFLKSVQMEPAGASAAD